MASQSQSQLIKAYYIAKSSVYIYTIQEYYCVVKIKTIVIKITAIIRTSMSAQESDCINNRT